MSLSLSLSLSLYIIIYKYIYTNILYYSYCIISYHCARSGFEFVSLPRVISLPHCTILYHSYHCLGFREETLGRRGEKGLCLRVVLLIVIVAILVIVIGIAAILLIVIVAFLLIVIVAILLIVIVAETSCRKPFEAHPMFIPRHIMRTNIF